MKGPGNRCFVLFFIGPVFRFREAGRHRNRRALLQEYDIRLEGELRSSSYDKELPVIGGGTAIVP